MCKSCEVLVINSVLCHEYGCPEAWKDHKRYCKECGTEFIPEESGQTFCSSHCACIYNGYVCDCEICQEMNEELDEEQIKMDNTRLLNRLQEIYNRLVDETENSATYKDFKKNAILAAMLQTIEYIKGDSVDNPMDDIFFA